MDFYTIIFGLCIAFVVVLIAYVGQLQSGSSMLHFEMYSGAGSGRLTVRSNTPYQRRADLIDPTNHLDQATLTL
jgi:hypothetical protein